MRLHPNMNMLDGFDGIDRNGIPPDFTRSLAEFELSRRPSDR
jgi:hypothetical protein